VDKKYVLLVGDPEYSARLNFKEFFEQGFVLHWAKSLAQAQRLLAEGSSFDLLILEASADPHGTDDFCKSIKKSHAWLKIAYFMDNRTPPRDCVDLLLDPTDTQAELVVRLRDLFESAA